MTREWFVGMQRDPQVIDFPGSCSPSPDCRVGTCHLPPCQLHANAACGVEAVTSRQQLSATTFKCL